MLTSHTMLHVHLLVLFDCLVALFLQFYGFIDCQHTDFGLHCNVSVNSSLKVKSISCTWLSTTKLPSAVKLLLLLVDDGGAEEMEQLEDILRCNAVMARPSLLLLHKLARRDRLEEETLLARARAFSAATMRRLVSC